MPKTFHDIIDEIVDHIKSFFAGFAFGFHQLKTSTQISLKFTLFTMLQVLLFSLLANGIFFQNWYNRQQTQITQGLRPMMLQKMILGKKRGPETEIFPINSPEATLLQNAHRRKSIAKIDNMYFMYKKFGNQLLVTNVTPHMIVQKNLIWISIYLMLLFGAIAYILSHFFVKTSLKKLNQLLGFLDHLHIDNLDEKIQITGHPLDEINRVSKKFNEAMEKIHKQTLSLKDFVTNASHELKTPLMSMSTEIDYMMKTKTYQQGLSTLKLQLKNMNSLLETLVMISKLEALEQLETQEINLSTLTENVVYELQKTYHDKDITLELKIAKSIIKKAHQESWMIIVKNILENAYKFTPAGGAIHIALDANKLSIKDTGKGIAPQDLDHVRERFWQADRSKTDTKSFGLGLYLTKLLVQKHGRTISLTSKVNKGTTCMICF